MTEENALAPPDLSLIHPYTRYDKPYDGVIHFQKGNKNLYYVSAAHVVGTDNPIDQAIKMVMERYHPQAVIIESTRSFLASDVNENGYAEKLGRMHNAEIIPGEPPDANVMKAELEKGYSPKDVMAFYMLRYIPYDRRMGNPIDEQSFAERTAQMLNESFPEYKEKITFPEFKQWYEQHKTNNKPLMDIENSDMVPDNSPDASYFPKLAAGTGLTRDRHAISKIAQAFEKHDNVLVVYGNGHFTESSPVFTQMFGNKGEIIQFIPDPHTASPGTPQPSVSNESKLVNPQEHGQKKHSLMLFAKSAVALLGLAAAGLAISKWRNRGKVIPNAPKDLSR